MITETTTFTVDELGFIQLALNKVLVAVANGELDLNNRDYFRRALATRGDVVLEPTFGRLTGLTHPFVAFAQQSWAGGVLLLICAVGAITAGDRFTSTDNALTILRLAATIGVVARKAMSPE